MRTKNFPGRGVNRSIEDKAIFVLVCLVVALWCFAAYGYSECSHGGAQGPSLRGRRGVTEGASESDNGRTVSSTNRRGSIAKGFHSTSGADRDAPGSASCVRMA